MIKHHRQPNKGFTLAEMLIVVGIIGVLTATAVPIFSSLSERAKEATDLANIRSAYAEVMVEVVTDQSTTHSAIVTMVQTKADWQTDDTESTLQRLAPGHIEGVPSGEKGSQTTVQWNVAGYLEIIFDGEGSGGGEGPKYNIVYNDVESVGRNVCKGIKDVIDQLKGQGYYVFGYSEFKKSAYNVGGSVYNNSVFVRETSSDEQVALRMKDLLLEKCDIDLDKIEGISTGNLYVYCDDDGEICSFSYTTENPSTHKKELTYYYMDAEETKSRPISEDEIPDWDVRNQYARKEINPY